MQNQNNQGSGIPRASRNIFGIIMILIYLGMGILCLTNVFDWFGGSWEWLRWVGGSLFIVYGIWRAYRQFAGIDAEIGSRP